MIGRPLNFSHWTRTAGLSASLAMTIAMPPSAPVIDLAGLAGPYVTSGQAGVDWLGGSGIESWVCGSAFAGT